MSRRSLPRMLLSGRAVGSAVFTELVPVPSEGGTTWNVIMTAPYQWRIEFACTSKRTAVNLRLALDDVTSALVEPAE